MKSGVIYLALGGGIPLWLDATTSPAVLIEGLRCRDVRRVGARSCPAGSGHPSGLGASRVASGRERTRRRGDGPPFAPSGAQHRRAVSAHRLGARVVRAAPSRGGGSVGDPRQTTDHCHGVHRSADGRRAMDRPLDCRTGGQTQTGAARRPGNDSGAFATPRPQAVAGKNVVPR